MNFGSRFEARIAKERADIIYVSITPCNAGKKKMELKRKATYEVMTPAY